MNRCYVRGCRRRLDRQDGGEFYGLCRSCFYRKRRKAAKERCPCMACKTMGILPLATLDIPEDPSPFDAEEDRREEFWECFGMAKL